MLEEPEGMTAHTRHILGLFFPLRARVEGGKPISIGDLLDYCELRGLLPLDLFYWLSVADTEALAWMGEQQKKSTDDVRRRAETRH